MPVPGFTSIRLPELGSSILLLDTFRVCSEVVCVESHPIVALSLFAGRHGAGGNCDFRRGRSYEGLIEDLLPLRRSVSVEPFVFRKPCTNDLIVSQEKSFRDAHIHLTAHELTRRMAEAVSEGFSLASSMLDAFLKTREEPVADPVETIRKIAEARKFSQKLTDEVVSSYLVEPEANRFGMINAFTNAAQKLGPLHRIEMERFAGTLLEAPLQ